MHPALPRDSRDPFLTTAWTLVDAAAGRTSGADLEASWRQLVEAYHDAIGATVRRLAPIYLAGLRAQPPLDELTADVFSYLFERRVLERATAARGRFRAFLQGVVRNRLRYLGRHGRRGPALEPLPEIDAAEDRRWRIEEERAWARALLTRALRCLSERQPREAEAFCLRHGIDPAAADAELGEPLSLERVAERLRTTRATVNMRLYRARRALFGLVRHDIASSTIDFASYEAERSVLEPHLDELRDVHS